MILFLIILIFIPLQHSSNQIIVNYEDLNYITFLPLYVFYPKNHTVFVDNQHIVFNDSIVMIFSNFFSSTAVICLLLSEFSFSDYHKIKKLREPLFVWARFLKNKDVSNEFIILKFLKFNLLRSFNFLKKFIILIKFFIKKNIFKIYHNYSHLRFLIKFYLKKRISKNLFWKPLFKRISYWGLYSSAKLKWKKLK